MESYLMHRQIFFDPTNLGKRKEIQEHMDITLFCLLHSLFIHRGNFDRIARQ